MPKLDQIIKQMALEAVIASAPTSVVFGTVVSVSPIQIRIDQKITLTSEFLVLARNVTNYKTTIKMDGETETDNASHTHKIKCNTEDGGTDTHNHTLNGYTEDAEAEHSHKISGEMNVTINNGLSVSDEVILLRVQGGQKYVVLDKVGKKDDSND